MNQIQRLRSKRNRIEAQLKKLNRAISAHNRDVRRSLPEHEVDAVTRGMLMVNPISARRVVAY